MPATDADRREDSIQIKPSVATWALALHPRIGRVARRGAQLNRFSGECIPPKQWGISLSQLKAFLRWCPEQLGWSPSMSVRSFVENIIKPNFKGGQSVALSFQESPHPLTIRWLVSHCWDEETEQFLLDVIFLAEQQGCSPDEGIFICCFCLFQGDEDELFAQVGQGLSDIRLGCFAQVLAEVKEQKGEVWVIANDAMLSTDNGLYSRLWCGWEAYQAKEKGVRIILHPRCSTLQHLFGNEWKRFSLKDGSCGNPSQKTPTDATSERCIRLAIENGLGWAEVDATVKVAVLNSWSQSTDNLQNAMEFLGDSHRGVREAALLKASHLVECQELSDATLDQFIANVVSGDREPHHLRLLSLLDDQRGAHALVRVLYESDNPELAKNAKQLLDGMTANRVRECDFAATPKRSPSKRISSHPSFSSNPSFSPEDE